MGDKDICPHEFLYHVEYADRILLPSNETIKLQVFLNRLEGSVGLFAMHFTDFNCYRTELPRS